MYSVQGGTGRLGMNQGTGMYLVMYASPATVCFVSKVLEELEERMNN